MDKQQTLEHIENLWNGKINKTYFKAHGQINENYFTSIDGIKYQMDNFPKETKHGMVFYLLAEGHSNPKLVKHKVEL